MESKGSQREPKGSPKGDLGCLGEPMGAYAVLDPHFESVCCSFRGLFLEPKPLKIGSKNRSKNPRNSSKIVPKTMENLQKEARGDQKRSPNR